MVRIPALSAALCLSLAPFAAADEIEDSIAAALEAYRAGDLATAKDEIDFAAVLLGQKKAEGLGAYLPAPLSGWTREDDDSDAAAAAMFGGGLTAGAEYVQGAERIEIRLIADSPMIAGMAGMLGNAAMMAAQGEVRRVGKQRYLIARDGQIMALVGGKVLVQLSGEGALEDKIAYFEAIDFAGLEAF
ncbi:hypothetical protein G5B40_04440 [Pikeienuella piscinae]|uniref:Uncharacterized protein n=1 Tax=Pikeienuella piscinae TaxID=2748098 RepID=A0A7L5BXY1_9RHOB|nr:hypothetical protein [Pikeienuella piscinae]QIE54754.1 hypothetical protein G5B40_04440 [Pikeienuella piscinae]